VAEIEFMLRHIVSAPVVDMFEPRPGINPDTSALPDPTAPNQKPRSIRTG
jgi:hypothetical protein